jgi:hypothetical protein
VFAATFSDNDKVAVNLLTISGNFGVAANYLATNVQVSCIVYIPDPSLNNIYFWFHHEVKDFFKYSREKTSKSNFLILLTIIFNLYHLYLSSNKIKVQVISSIVGVRTIC